MSESKGIMWVLGGLIHVRVWGDYIGVSRVNPCQSLGDYVGVRRVNPCQSLRGLC